LLLGGVSLLSAQRVIYCTPVDDRYFIRWEVAGRAGDYYWIHITRKKRENRRHPDPVLFEVQNFDIYDARMNPFRTVQAYPISDTTLKEYLIAGDHYFDQLILLGGNKKTTILLQRYEPQGNRVDTGRVLGSFPFNESGNSFLLVRSEDRSKMLLLGFESVQGSAPKIHAVLFDQDWGAYYYRVYKSASFSQPFIQDDFAGYPLENFNKGPVKLANNGQWLMTAPSRTSNNFLLFHFNNTDPSFSYKDISMPVAATMEDMDLSVNNEKGEAFAGILSSLNYDVLKEVRVAHYSMNSQHFDFDSSYLLNTLVAGRIRNQNLVKEDFIAVPGRGFMLLKEYGRAFEDWYDQDFNDHWDPAAVLAENMVPDKGVSAPALRDGYAKYSLLGPLGSTHERGDLGMFYFPACRTDSCWSGMISKEQVTELNAPNLSYLVMPVRDRLFFLYNSFIRNTDPYASTTILDTRGEVLPDEGVFFWKLKNILNFQQSRQISNDEVVVPYAEFQRRGFAIIRF